MQTFETPYWKSSITKYAEHRLNGKNMSESARLAGYSPALQNQAGARLEPKAEVRIKQALENAGITNDVLSQVILDGLKAEDADKRPNHRIRYDFTKLALEAKGELKSGASVAIQINLPGDFLEPWGDEDV